MVDDKQRPGESEGDSPERAPETGRGAGGSQPGVNEAAGVDDAPAPVPPGEPVAAEAGRGSEVEGRTSSAETEPVAEVSRPPSLPPPVVRQRTPWGAMLVSGIIGGAIVAGAATYGYVYHLPNDNSAINVLFARLGAAELALRDLSDRPAAPQANAASQQAMSALVDRLAKVEASLAAAASAAAAASDSSKPATSGPAAAEQLAATKALSDDVARLNQRMEETAKALQQARDSAAAAMKAAEAKAGEPSAGIGKQELDALGERVASLQRTMASLQQAVQRQTTETSQEDRGVRLALVSAGLRAAVERGAPYAAELEAAKGLMADPQAVALLAPYAATGVPSAAALGQELAALAPSLAKRAPAAAGAEPSYWQLLQSEAGKLVRVRPVNEAPGSDSSAVISRTEAMGKRADIAGALAELQKLPEAARAPAEPWIKKAQAREAAIAAARRIEAQAVAALAKHQ